MSQRQASERGEGRMTQAERTALSDRRMFDAAIELINERGTQKTTLKEIGERVRLTRTQTEFIVKWTVGFTARGGDAERLRAVLPEVTPKTKDGNKRVFTELKHVLKN